MNPDEPQTPSSDPANIPINLPPREPISFTGKSGPEEDLTRRVTDLQQQEKALRQEIASLQSSYNAMLQKQVAETQMAIGRLVKEGVSDLEQRKQTLQVAIEQLERRQERIKAEMRTTFAGSSQDLAMRVQGFKDYLVGSLQDLATSAEQLQLTVESREVRSEPPREAARETIRETGRDGRETLRERPDAGAKAGANRTEEISEPRFTESRFQEQAKRIRKLLDQYRASPDYYGPPWQLRRTFEPVHAERVSTWFFNQGGRGAIRTMGSRLQNILIASATISVLNEIYGERLRPLILGNSPERLGEWRRGLQDCLGVSRADFGIDEGIVLFEAPEPLAQRAERLVKQKQLPLIIIDETEEYVSVALLQFPLWLAFAPDPTAPPAPMY